MNDVTIVIIVCVGYTGAFLHTYLGDTGTILGMLIGLVAGILLNKFTRR